MAASVVLLLLPFTFPMRAPKKGRALPPANRCGWPGGHARRRGRSAGGQSPDPATASAPGRKCGKGASAARASTT
eukprot:7728432-Pyramimonas_sp.AAC.1